SGVRADVESGGRGDRHAAGGVAADHTLFRRRDDKRERSRSGEGADQGTDRAIRGSDLQGKGTRSRMVGDNVMRTRAIAAAAALMFPPRAAQPAELAPRIPPAMKAAVDELAPPFERANRHVLRITYGPSGGLARRLNAGEAADLVVVDS